MSEAREVMEWKPYKVHYSPVVDGLSGSPIMNVYSVEVVALSPEHAEELVRTNRAPIHITLVTESKAEVRHVDVNGMALNEEEQRLCTCDPLIIEHDDGTPYIYIHDFDTPLREVPPYQDPLPEPYYRKSLFDRIKRRLFKS